MNLAEKLRQLMELKKITAQELISEINLNQSTLSRLLSCNTARPKQSTLQELANYFNVPITEFNLDHDNCVKNIVTLKKNSGYQLAENLLILMKQHNVSANILSEKTGVSYETIRLILNQKIHNPQIETIRALAKFFKIKEVDLVSKIDTPCTATKLTTIPIIKLSEVETWLKSSNFKYDNWVKLMLSEADNNVFAIYIEDNIFEFFDIGQTIIFSPNAKPRTHDTLVAIVDNLLWIYKYKISEKNEIYIKKCADKARWQKINQEQIDILACITQVIFDKAGCNNV